MGAMYQAFRGMEVVTLVTARTMEMDAAAGASNVCQGVKPEGLLGSRDSHLLHPEGGKGWKAGHTKTSKQGFAATQGRDRTGLAQDASSRTREKWSDPSYISKIKPT